MTEERFMLVSLKEEESKKLAQVISNDTSRKILDYLSEHQKATETELAKFLDLPISTVHYNLQHLVKAKLVKVDEFHYSEKGREINHYSLANKFVIIAPQKTENVLEQLKKLIPTIIIIAGVAIVIKLISLFTKPKFYVTQNEFISQQPLLEQQVMDKALLGSETPIATQKAAQPLYAIAENITNITQNITENVSKIVEKVTYVTTSGFNINQFLLYFLIGSLFTIILIVLVTLIRRKK